MTAATFAARHDQQIRYLGTFTFQFRRVADVFSGWLEAGMRRLAWSGVDADGRALPSGTYVLRVTTPTGAASRTVTLLK